MVESGRRVSWMCRNTTAGELHARMTGSGVPENQVMRCYLKSTAYLIQSNPLIAIHQQTFAALDSFIQNFHCLEIADAAWAFTQLTSKVS